MIIIDILEQRNEHHLEMFKYLGIEATVDHLDFGDYYNTVTNIAVERKKDLIELCGNAGRNHSRFKAELERMKSANAKMYLLIEQPRPPKLREWKNPKGFAKLKKYKHIDKYYEIKPMDGEQLTKILLSWVAEYDIQIVFCKKRDAPEILLSLLNGGDSK